MERTGGCLCGAVRYRVTAEPLHATHCHCSMCRRASGAAFLTFATFPASALTWTEGEPAVYRSSPAARDPVTLTPWSVASSRSATSSEPSRNGPAAGSERRQLALPSREQEHQMSA